MLDRRSLVRSLAVAGGAAAVAPRLALTALADEGFAAGRAAYGDAAISMDRVVVPMVFPIVGGASYSDTFLACRSGCTRKHLGQDLMAPKMRPLVAVFNGTITSLKRESTPGEGNYLALRGDHGWTAMYIHLNNDTPGTDDGRGTALHAFAPGIAVGKRVVQGQLLGWNGDSGNAEGTAPHCHFELRRNGDWNGTVYNPKPSLDAAVRLQAPGVAGPHPEGALIRSKTGGPVFLLQNGRKRVVSPAVMALNGWSPSQVLTVSKAEADWYPRHWDVIPRPGLVLRDAEKKLWLVVDNTRVPVPDLALVGVRESRVRDADAATLALLRVPDAGVVPGVLHDGALVRRAGDHRIWLIEGGKRRLVPDVHTMISWAMSYDDVWPVPADAFDLVDALVEEGEPLPLRDGTVIRHAKGWTWLIAGGKKRYVTNMTAFAGYGYGRVPRLTAPVETITRQPDGPSFP